MSLEKNPKTKLQQKKREEHKPNTTGPAAIPLTCASSFVTFFWSFLERVTSSCFCCFLPMVSVFAFEGTSVVVLWVVLGWFSTDGSDLCDLVRRKEDLVERRQGSFSLSSSSLSFSNLLDCKLFCSRPKRVFPFARFLVPASFPRSRSKLQNSEAHTCVGFYSLDSAQKWRFSSLGGNRMVFLARLCVWCDTSSIEDAAITETSKAKQEVCRLVGKYVIDPM